MWTSRAALRQARLPMLNYLMQIARKQHYIPQFYLKRWAIDGKLVEFSRPNPKSREVKPHRKPPKGTAWKEGAYDFEGLPPEKRHYLEKVFFHLVDSKAADALVIIENGRGNWTDELRQAWAMFLISLIVRHPADIAAFKAVYRRDFKEISGAEEVSYQNARSPDDPATIEEYYETLGTDFFANLAVNNIPELINHERSVADLMNMHWLVAEPAANGYFLTSDRPTIRSFLGFSNSHWVLPIGPRKLFVAAKAKTYGEAIVEVVGRNAWKEINRQVLRPAVALGFADNERHLPLFQKHLAAATRPSIFLSFVPNPKTAPPLDRVP